MFGADHRGLTPLSEIKSVHRLTGRRVGPFSRGSDPAPASGLLFPLETGGLISEKLGPHRLYNNRQLAECEVFQFDLPAGVVDVNTH